VITLGLNILEELIAGQNRPPNSASGPLVLTTDLPTPPVGGQALLKTGGLWFLITYNFRVIVNLLFFSNQWLYECSKSPFFNACPTPGGEFGVEIISCYSLFERIGAS